MRNVERGMWWRNTAGYYMTTSCCAEIVSNSPAGNRKRNLKGFAYKDVQKILFLRVFQ